MVKRISKDCFRWHHVKFSNWVVISSEKNWGCNLQKWEKWWNIPCIYTLTINCLHFETHLYHLAATILPIFPEGKTLVLNLFRGKIIRRDWSRGILGLHATTHVEILEFVFSQLTFPKESRCWSSRFDYFMLSDGRVYIICTKHCVYVGKFSP